MADIYKKDDNLQCDLVEPTVDVTDENPVPLDVIGPELEPEIEDIGLGTGCDANTLVGVASDETPPEYYTIGRLFGTLQMAVLTVWRYHLKTKKHYIHVELDALYHYLLGKTDELIERYQGCVCGTVEAEENVVYDINDSGERKTEFQYLIDLRTYILACRKSVISEELTELWSTLDDIIGFIDQTIYKIDTFKEEPVQKFDAYCYEHLNIK